MVVENKDHDYVRKRLEDKGVINSSQLVIFT